MAYSMPRPVSRSRVEHRSVASSEPSSRLVRRRSARAVGRSEMVPSIAALMPSKGQAVASHGPVTAPGPDRLRTAGQRTPTSDVVVRSGALAALEPERL